VRERLAALLTALVVPLALRLLPLRRALALCDRLPRLPGPRHAPAPLLARASRWLARGRGPWRPDCLTSAAVAYAMLRQHGHAARFHLGVRGEARRFEAHAWVSVDDTPVADPFAPRGEYRELLAHAG